MRVAEQRALAGDPAAPYKWAVIAQAYLAAEHERVVARSYRSPHETTGETSD
jgi:hypothetical protein